MIIPRSPYPIGEFLSMAWRRFRPALPWGDHPVVARIILDASIEAKSWVGFVGDICPLNKRRAKFSPDILNFFEPCSLMVGNFEGVTTEAGHRPFLHKHEPSIFDVLAAIKPLSKWVLSIANNHALDYGESSLEETINQFEKRSINWLGTKECPGVRIEHLDISFTAWTWWLNGKMRVVSAKDPGAPKWEGLHVAIPHWGYEHERSPRPSQRKRIPPGYDLVIGHHSHLPQPFEVCEKNLPVAWSLGNFITGKRLPVLGEGAILKVAVGASKSGIPAIREIHWQAILLDRDDKKFCHLKFRRQVS